MSANPMPSSNLLADLAAIVGQAHVLTSEADRDFYAMDVYNQLKVPLAVVQPGTIEELQKVVRTATGSGVAVVPRGGGASYTDGYLPTVSNSILLDTGRLNRIVEINEGDMYVTVEPGITWNDLWQALKAKGLRTTLLGPVLRHQGHRRRLHVPEQRQPGLRQLRRVRRRRAGLRDRAGQRRDPEDRLPGGGQRRAVLPLVRPRPDGPLHRRCGRPRRQGAHHAAS